MDRSGVLRQGLITSGVSQSELSRLSGVPQGRISQYVNGKLEPSPEMLERLLPMLGVTTTTTVQPVQFERTKYRSWLLHREVLRKLQNQPLNPHDWDRLRRSLTQVEQRTQGPTHERNLRRWQEILERRDERELRRVLVDLTDDGVGMREVSPVTGFLTEEERLNTIKKSWRHEVRNETT